MKYIVIIVLLIFATACSKTTSHVGDVQKYNSNSEYSIKDVQKGFVVYVHYSDYQFVRNSKEAFRDTSEIMNAIAEKYAAEKGVSIKPVNWNELTIIDHGRDIVSAIMRVNAMHTYEFQNMPNN